MSESKEFVVIGGGALGVEIAGELCTDYKVRRWIQGGMWWTLLTNFWQFWLSRLATKAYIFKSLNVSVGVGVIWRLSTFLVSTIELNDINLLLILHTYIPARKNPTESQPEFKINRKAEVWTAVLSPLGMEQNS